MTWGLQLPNVPKPFNNRMTQWRDWFRLCTCAESTGKSSSSKEESVSCCKTSREFGPKTPRMEKFDWTFVMKTSLVGALLREIQLSARVVRVGSVTIENLRKKWIDLTKICVASFFFHGFSFQCTQQPHHCRDGAVSHILIAPEWSTNGAHSTVKDISSKMCLNSIQVMNTVPLYLFSAFLMTVHCSSYPPIWFNMDVWMAQPTGMSISLTHNVWRRSRLSDAFCD